MKKSLSKCIFFGFVIIIALFVGGCQSLFIPKNVPMVIQDGNSSKSQSSQQITIESYQAICNGIVQDITSKGNALIVLNSENSETAFSIDFYNSDTQQLSTFINSDKRDLSALYDTFDTGIYYVEEIDDPISGKVGSHLLWTDINKDFTRIISLPEENVVKYFGIGELNQVVYINNNNNIILADNQGGREVYTTLWNYNILSVDLMKDNSQIAFIAYDPIKEGKTNLYYAEIKSDSTELLPKLVEENVTSFDINDLNNHITFVKNNMDYQSIGTWLSDNTTTNIIATGNFATAQYTPNGEKVILTQFSPNFDSQYQSVWIMDSNGKNALQITAPMKLNSRVICHPFKSILYFSIEKPIEDSISGANHILAQTYQIDYIIE